MLKPDVRGDGSTRSNFIQAESAGVCRRAFLTVLASLGATTFVRGAKAAESAAIDVWKSPSCGCCGGWVDYMRAKGYRINVKDVQDMETVKSRLGVPRPLISCHTARVGDYLIEGHVPEPAIAKLLLERPSLKGLALPGMPMGAPGMNGTPAAHVVLGFDDAGRAEAFVRSGA